MTAITYPTLISPAQLAALQAKGQPCMVFDCSFDLGKPSAGHQQFEQAHIPGAVYADLEQDLSAKHGMPSSDGKVAVSQADQPASGGRHPLPSRERFAVWLSSVGFSNAMQAVVYDRNGANFCGRLWWMLKWAGHDAVAVLDGGLQAWQTTGQPVAQGPEAGHFQTSFALRPALRRLVSANEVLAALGSPTQTLIDARSPARYRGEVEPLDPAAGHIPGALNRPFSENLAADGRFKPRELLRAEFQQLLGEHPASSVIHHCGSGVSALPNLLAMEVAGLGQTALFAGSWSEWCADATRPVARG